MTRREPPDPDRPEVLGLVDVLSAALAEEKVRYCHWKSNEAIDRSLRGENDLDLLIDRADTARFLETMARIGFKLALPPARKQMPGLVGLYGLDPDTARFVQVDAHFRLIAGDDMTKNFHLPIEAAYLAELDTSGPLPLPRPELEYLVFVIRMVLKHCPWDAQLSYKWRLTASEKRELAYLEERIDRAEVDALRSRLLPAVSAELFARSRRALGRELGPLARAAIGRDLVLALDGYNRRPPAADTALKVYRRVTGWVMRRLPWANLRKKPISGGAVVALVGGDGSGKSTAVEDLATFLSRHFFVRRFHLGKPRPSPAAWIARRVIRRLPATAPVGLASWEADQLTDFPGYGYLAAHLLTARERYRTHRAARRAAGAGAMAVCDRYPIAGMKTMDCPRLQGLAGVDRRKPARWMARREAWYYRRITLPDVVVVMRVDPEVAVSRRPEQDPAFVRRRAAEVFERNWIEPNVHVVDAGRPLESVTAEVRRLVWANL